MNKYRARACPNCHYYLGFVITKPYFKTTEASVTSFCLNCSYTLPIHGVIRGTRRVVSSFRRKWLRLVNVSDTPSAKRKPDPTQAHSGENEINPAAYSRHLRVVGQQLQKLQLTRFNLECTGSSYLIWTPSNAAETEDVPSWRLPAARLQKWWTVRCGPGSTDPQNPSLRGPRPAPRFKYLESDVERLDQLAKQQRHDANGSTDGHSLAQLLRTVGALVSERNHRLLGISWRDLSICIVIETMQGKREIDVFRPDNLYDLWVRMYLRRDKRALSDVPH